MPNDQLAAPSTTAAPAGRGPHDYEDNPYWAILDQTANDALLYSHTAAPYKPALEHAIQTSEAAGLQSIEVAPAAGKHLSVLIQLMILNRAVGRGSSSAAQEGEFHVLEIGTLGAYSAIWMASAHPSVRVTSIEYSASTAAVARRNIAHAGLEGRVTVHQGAALDVLAGITKEVQAGSRPLFDFGFIDADKVNNWNYFCACRDLSRVGALIAVDNISLGGLPVDPALVDLEKGEVRKKALEGYENWQDPTSNARGIRELFQEVGRDGSVEGVVVQTVTGGFWDGLLFAVKTG